MPKAVKVQARGSCWPVDPRNRWRSPAFRVSAPSPVQPLPNPRCPDPRPGPCRPVLGRSFPVGPTRTLGDWMFDAPIPWPLHEIVRFSQSVPSCLDFLPSPCSGRHPRSAIPVLAVALVTRPSLRADGHRYPDQRLVRSSRSNIPGVSHLVHFLLIPPRHRAITRLPSCAVSTSSAGWAEEAGESTRSPRCSGPACWWWSGRVRS